MALPSRAYHAWTPAEDAFLRANWYDWSLPALSKRLHRSRGGVHTRAKTLGLAFGCPRGREYLWHASRRLGVELLTFRHIVAFYEAHRKDAWIFGRSIRAQNSSPHTVHTSTRNRFSHIDPRKTRWTSI